MESRLSLIGYAARNFVSDLTPGRMTVVGAIGGAVAIAACTISHQQLTNNPDLPPYTPVAARSMECFKSPQNLSAEERNKLRSPFEKYFSKVFNETNARLLELDPHNTFYDHMGNTYCGKLAKSREGVTSYQLFSDDSLIPIFEVSGSAKGGIVTFHMSAEGGPTKPIPYERITLDEAQRRVEKVFSGEVTQEEVIVIDNKPEYKFITSGHYGENPVFVSPASVVTFPY